MDEAREGRLGFALLLACPACAGGIFLAIGTALGATALALKGFALAALLTVVLGLWARSVWRRRNEEDAPHCAP
jgi:membrane protein implicated in regulation of membrane protease activity